jgi:hypothetical protein
VSFFIIFLLVGWSTEVLGSQSSREETGIGSFRYKLSLLVSGDWMSKELREIERTFCRVLD